MVRFCRIRLPTCPMCPPSCQVSVAEQTPWGQGHAISRGIKQDVGVTTKCDGMWKILLPDHVGGLIFHYLKKEGYDVHIIKDKVWTKISDQINVLCLCDYNQDAALIVDINGRLIINMN